MDFPLNERERQSAPVLSAEQITSLRPLGEIRRTHTVDVLFEVGDATYPMVVVLAGRTEIIDRSEGIDRVIKTSGPGEFQAELGLLTGQAVFVACVVREAGEVLLIPAAAVQEIIATMPGLSDLLVTAFAARRRLLMRSAASILTIVGPRRHRGCCGCTSSQRGTASHIAGSLRTIPLRRECSPDRRRCPRRDNRTCESSSAGSRCSTTPAT